MAVNDKRADQLPDIGTITDAALFVLATAAGLTSRATAAAVAAYVGAKGGLPALSVGGALQLVRANAAGSGFELVQAPAAFPGFYPGPTAANWIRPGTLTGTSSTLTVTANLVYMSAYYLPVRYAPTRAAVEVTTALAGTCDATLWAMTAGARAGAKQFRASISTAATGIIPATVAPGTLEQGWYVSRIICSVACALRAHQTSIMNPWGWGGGNNAPVSAKTWPAGSFLVNPTTAEDIGSTNVAGSGVGFTDIVGAAPMLLLQ